MSYVKLTTDLRIILKLWEVNKVREYETEQRKMLLLFFENHPDNHFTVEDLASKLNGVSISTVYRNVNQMVKEGSIRSFKKEDTRKLVYQYIGTKTCNEHLHLKCNKCGKILHTDEKNAALVKELIQNNYDFEMDKATTILFGSCKSCK